MPRHEQYADVHLVTALILTQQTKGSDAVVVNESLNDRRGPMAKDRTEPQPIAVSRPAGPGTFHLIQQCSLPSFEILAA
jgi:hypothetical protein